MIKILTEETINKIAAGEVVERPASVVKELLENAIDAGASHIVVEVKAGGKNLIRVTDNGIGMDREDALLSIERHATSKISSADDLESIHTLGFRGEALPSIASISKLTLISRTKSSSSAIRIQIEGGRVKEVKETGAPSGTMVEVASLFFNTPGRRKFLKTNTTEFTHIIKSLTNYALAYCNCGFKLSHNNESIIEVLSRDSLLDRIRLLCGREASENVVALDFEREGVKISGYVSNPTFTKPNRSGQFIFVNRRPIANRAINYAISEGYSSLVPRDRFPVVFLFIDVSPDAFDVNVHPTKREVKFGNERLIKEILVSAIQQALYGKVDTATPAKWDSVNYTSAAMQMQESLLEKDFQQQFSMPKQEQDVSVIQMNNSYIIAEVADGFEIIDQHAAHERIIYEKIKKRLGRKESIGQRLLIPITLELTPDETELLKRELVFLTEAGFNIEDFGKHSMIIDMIPSILDKVDVAGLIKDILSELKEQTCAASHDSVRDDIIKIMACHAAVKQGDKLDAMEIHGLMKEWRQVPQYYTCPHGRPSVIKMKCEELNKQFHRT